MRALLPLPACHAARPPPQPTPPHPLATPGAAVWILPKAEPVLDPYNNSLVMPLAEWIEHPIAEELIHNGATLQVLGLTNYSFWQVGGLNEWAVGGWVVRWVGEACGAPSAC